ncbi:TIGR00366 family protein [Acinetobacter baumannii]
MLGLALHGTPRNFLNAVAKAVPAVSGILIQFPLYGSIAFIMTQALNSQDLSLSHYIAEFFVSIASKETFAIVMGIYSAVLGFLYLQVVENGLLKPHMLCKQQMI